MIRGPPTCVNSIFTCHHGSSWMPGASSGKLGETDGSSKRSRSIATDGVSVAKACFSHGRTFFTAGVRPRHPPGACTVAVVEGCAVRYVQAAETPLERLPHDGSH
jgi:hypothetical protein